jgi:hypothetical protein
LSRGYADLNLRRPVACFDTELSQAAVPMYPEGDVLSAGHIELTRQRVEPVDSVGVFASACELNLQRPLACLDIGLSRVAAMGLEHFPVIGVGLWVW